MSEIDFKQYPDYVLHQFACDVAERVLLKVWELTDEEPDERSVNAIAVKRRWLEGKDSDEELTIARDAAREAAWCAARSAASDAARDAAWDAARSAAWYAAWHYAAWSAASYAAWAAAWSAAANAAWAAAGAAARYAARDIACNEERAWQAEHIEKLHEEYKQSRAFILKTLLRRKELLTPAAYDWTAETESILFLGV